MSSWGIFQKVSKGLKKAPGIDKCVETPIIKNIVRPVANDQIQGGPPPTDCGIGGCPRPGANGHGVRKMVGMNGHGIRLTPDQIISKHIQLKNN